MSSVFAVVPPHVVVENAFGQEMADQLLAYALTCESAFTNTQVGRHGTTQVAVRRSRKFRDLGPLKADLEARFRAALPAARSILGFDAFGLAALELELAAHGDGDYYRRHIDTFAGVERQNMDRVVTGVYYFHRMPKAFEGGALRLFTLLPPEQGGSWVDIEPLNDSLVLFPSWAPHEVLPVSCTGQEFAQSRFAINCWYKKTLA